MAAIILDKIKYQVNNNVIIDQLSFALNKHRVACILGQSGGGKTTLLRCIAGLEKITAGSICLGDKTVSSATVHVPPEKRRVGFVFQDNALFPHLTVEENITYGMTGEKKIKKDKSRILLQTLELVGVSKRYPLQLSGGQQQRVAIARALAPQPEILLFDEPLSSIDMQLRETVKDTLRKIFSYQQMTVIFVTHDQFEAFDLADDIGLLANGKILQWGSAQQLYNAPQNIEVANFIGIGVALPLLFGSDGKLTCAIGRVNETDVGCQHVRPHDRCQLFVRPDDLVISSNNDGVKAKVIGKMFRGTHLLYRLKLANDTIINCFFANTHLSINNGDIVPVKLQPKRQLPVFCNCK